MKHLMRGAFSICNVLSALQGALVRGFCSPHNLRNSYPLCVGQRKPTKSLMEKTETIFQELRGIRLELLGEYGLTESDVMEDEVGSYVYLDEENGLRKVYLPSTLDLIF